ncbi:17633_t:CDS:1, partial [Rhizophagus irregularis]
MKTKFIVSGTLIILIAFIFPPLFIYVADGLSKLTIISTALYWRTIASILIAIITFLISKDELNKKIEIAIIILAIPLTLIMIISHQPLVFYATNNLDSVTITYLVLLDSLIFIVNFLELAKRHFTSYCSPKLFTWGGIMLVLISLSMVIYSVVIAIKFGWKYSYITAIVRDGH